MQAMLEDRFKMKSHHETRVMPGFALVVAKNGPKFKESIPGDLYPGGLKGVDAVPWLGVVGRSAPGVETGQHVSMEEVADLLSGPAGGRLRTRPGSRLLRLQVHHRDPRSIDNSGYRHADWPSIMSPRFWNNLD